MGEDFLAQVPDPYPVWSDLPWSGLPWPFYLRHARGVIFRNCTVTWQDATGHWQPEAVRCEDAEVAVQDIRLVNPPQASTAGRVFPTGEIDGVPYYKPPVGFDYAQELRLAHEWNDANAEDAGRVAADASLSITGSFVYAHPADYRGRPMLFAAVPEWRGVFRRLKSMRITTVIFQSALWRELGDCYYHSARYAGILQCYGVIERMLEAAAAESMHVFLGGYGSVAGWKAHLSSEELRQELDEHAACFRELVRLGAIDGMYFPSETAFEGDRRPEQEQRMHTLYAAFNALVKEHDPRLKVIVSPATLHRPEDNACFGEFWDAILDGTGIDVLMPQDSIGTCHTRIRDLPSLWSAWKAVADRHRITLWSHTEIFERRGYTPECSLVPADPARVAAQLAQVAPFVRKACCWEALHFTDPAAGPAARRLLEFLQGSPTPG